MPTISICTIVKNEERRMKEFISSLIVFADEIIMIDTGSTDETLKIIEDFVKNNNNIKLYKYFYEGVFHYGKAKNFAIEKASEDYVIVLDADEKLSDEFKNNIRGFLEKETPDIARIKRIDDYINRLIDYPERIIKNNINTFYKINERGMVHESLEHFREVKDFINYPIWHCQRWNHYAYRPQRIFSQLELQVERAHKTKSFAGHCIRGVWYAQFRFKKLYIKRKLYKNGKRGFKYAFMRALDAFLIELFVGLKPKKDFKYWENDNYKKSIK
ncbi:MAG TPA: glycosyltransferase family 2 protein [Ignavibacteria bacterium]|nr:glycosyltransferase family 2 protein [Ignavibacteria bacterium]